MTYEHDLAYNLRLRGIPEAQVAEAILEVRAHTSATGASAEAEFGSAADYASTFPRAKRRTPGVRVVTAATILAIAYVVAVFAIKALTDFDTRTVTGPVMLWPALAVLGAGVLGGFLTDYLRPTPRASRR